MSKQLKKVKIRDFVQELLERIDEADSIDCCKEEIKKFALVALAKMPDETIEIAWK